MKKKLYKSRKDRILSGVCGGIAEYLDIDASIIRVVVVVILIMNFGIGILLYILTSMVMPSIPYSLYQNMNGYGGNYDAEQSIIQNQDRASETNVSGSYLEPTFEDIRKDAVNVESVRNMGASRD